MEIIRQLDPVYFYTLLGGALVLYYAFYFLWLKKRRNDLKAKNQNIEKVKIFGNSKNITNLDSSTSTTSEMEPSEATTENVVDGRAADADFAPLQDPGVYSPSAFDYGQHVQKKTPLSSEADNLNNEDDGQKIITLRPSRKEGPKGTS